MSGNSNLLRRYAILLLLIVALCCSVIAIGACKRHPDNSTTPEHRHGYVEKVTTPATCTQDGLKTFTCECGASYNQVIKATGHSLKYTADGNEHIEQCENCDEATKKVAHNFNVLVSTEPSTCTQKGNEILRCVCGATTSRELPLAEHSLQYAKDTTQHWQKCKNCDYATAAVAHSYDILVSGTQSTCTVKGSKTTKCVCGDELVEELPLAEHKFNKITYDEIGHYTVCSVCNTADPDNTKQPHQYSQTVVTELTCTQNEVSAFSCDCGYSYTEVTQVTTGHELDRTQFTKRTNVGHFYKCVKCGTEISEPHEEIDVECSNNYNRAATCYQTGHQDKQCTICERITEYSLPKTDDHNFSSEWETSGTFHWHPCLNGDGKCDAKGEETQHTFETVRQEPTCTEAGYERKVCLCGRIQNNRNLPTVAHDYEETVLIQASCTQTGEIQKVCKVCQDTVIETVAQLKHDWTEWGSDATKHWKICSVCKTVQDSTANHDLRKTETKSATCTDDGYELSVCNACGYEQRKVIAAHHNYYAIDEGRVDPTCKDYGTHVEICSVCNDTTTVVDESLGYAPHDVVYHAKTDATDDADGNIAYWQCNVCDRYFSSHNCERELFEDDIFIRAPKTHTVETIAELQEIASSKFVGEASSDWYLITLTVLQIESADGYLALYDYNDDIIEIYVYDVIYNLNSIDEGDVITIKGHLIADTAGVTLLDVKIVEVDCGDEELVDLIFTIKGDIDYVMLYFSSDMVDEQYVVSYGYMFNLYNFHYLMVGEQLTLTYKNYTGVVITSLLINGKSYAMVNGELTVEVTEDMHVEIEFSKYATSSVTADNIDAHWDFAIVANLYTTVYKSKEL